MSWTVSTNQIPHCSLVLRNGSSDPLMWSSVSSFEETQTIQEVCLQAMLYLNFRKYVFRVFTLSLWVLPLQCENADLYTNCGKALHKRLIWFPLFSSHKSQRQSYLWTNAFLVEQQCARCLTMWKDSIVLIVARFAIGLVNLSKKIRFFPSRELLCIFRGKLEQSWWALSRFEF